MGYFPFYMDISGKKCVIVGGGTVALRKAEKLYSFHPEITVIAPQIHPELSKMKGLHIVRRPFTDADIEDAFMVITATDDPDLNRHIFALCSARRIPVNSVDDADNCSFIFPALVHRDPVTVGISTGGASPVFARYLREQTEALLTDHLLAAADILSRIRPEIKRRFPSEASRKAALETILALCLTAEKLPEDTEIEAVLERIYENQNRNQTK